MDRDEVKPQQTTQARQQQQQHDRRVSMRKQNAISVTLTSDCLDTTHLNEVSIPTLKLEVERGDEKLNHHQHHHHERLRQNQQRPKLSQQVRQPVGLDGRNGDDDEHAHAQTKFATQLQSQSTLFQHKPQPQLQQQANRSADMGQPNNNTNFGAAAEPQQRVTLHSSIGGNVAPVKQPTTQIPNVFFSKLQTIEDKSLEEVEYLENSQQVNKRLTTGPLKSPAHSPSIARRNVSQGANNAPAQYYYVTSHNQANKNLGQNSVGQQVPIMAMIINENLTPPSSPVRSAASSPRIARRMAGGVIGGIGPSAIGGSTNELNSQQTLYVTQSNLSNLNVSTTFTRKFSLQPVGQQQQHQQNTNVQQYILLDNNSNQYQATALSPNGLSAAGLLNPTSNISSTPRKSLIGRLERTSFQAQRLSDVGVAFGQQITAKMGLKLPASQERIVEQTRWLYLRYLFMKLRQNKLPLRDLNLTKTSRARRAAALGATTTTASSNLINSTSSSSSSQSIRQPASTSLSAPASATVNDFFNTDKTRLGLPANRKRAAIGNDIDQDQLTLLKNRMSIISQQGQSAPLQSIRVDQTPVVMRKYVMDPTINNQIFSVILDISRDLRDWKPEYYGDTLYELIGIDKFSSLETLLEVQMTICQEMTRSEITWCRITALISLFGAMSLDCVRLGAPEHVGPILDGFLTFVERDLALWISQQGGWESFLYKYRSGLRLGPAVSKAMALAVPLVIFILLAISKW